MPQTCNRILLLQNVFLTGPPGIDPGREVDSGRVRGGKPMSRMRFSAEQIIKHLREAEILLAKGQSVGDVCRQLSNPRSTTHVLPNQRVAKAQRQISRPKTPGESDRGVVRSLGRGRSSDAVKGS